MGTLTALSVIKKAQILLQDTTSVRWTQLELLGWLNDAQREVVMNKPNAFVVNGKVPLVAGTKQSLPSDGVQLISVVRNLGSTGTVQGDAIRITQREALDAQIPGWHSQAAATTILHYMFSPFDMKTFYVYPPSVVPNNLEIIYGASPTALADAALTNSAVISVDDIYQTVLIDYILYRAYSKDAEYAADAQRSQFHQQAYMNLLTGKAKLETVFDPNSAAPFNPNVTPNSR